MAHSKHEQVRRRFQFRCGYCGVAEKDTGGELTIDHFQPVSEGGQDDDDNLVYACFRCNLYKARYFGAALSGHRFSLLHPLLDDIEQLIQQDYNGMLVGLTDQAKDHIAILHLNRPQLVAYRWRKQQIALLRERETQLHRMIEHAQDLLVEIREYLEKIE